MSMKENPDLELRYKKFLRDLRRVEKFEPRSLYLYPIIRGVPFSDLHTALEMALLAKRRAKNDNMDTGEA